MNDSLEQPSPLDIVETWASDSTQAPERPGLMFGVIDLSKWGSDEIDELIKACRQELWFRDHM